MRSASLRRAAQVLLTAALVGLVMLVPASTAGAHAALVEVVPAADTTVEQAPTEVRLTFTEGVSVTSGSIRLFDPAARELPGIEADGQGTEVRAELPALERTGSYTVAWKVVSADGHPITGAYLFHLGEATLEQPVDVAGASTSRVADVFRAVGGVLALAALAWCMASAFAGTPLGDRRWWGLRWVPVVAGTMLLLGGAIVSVGAGASDSLEVVLDTSSGRMAVAAVLLAVAGLLASVAPVPKRTDAVLAVLTAAAVALQGHAVSLPPVGLSAVATVLHVLAALLWGGGLLWVEHRTRRSDEDELRAEVERRSPWGVGAVIVLALSGGLLVVDRVPFDELLSSGYGRLSLAKLALLGLAVVLAWTNRRAVLAEVRADAGSAEGGGQEVDGAGERNTVARDAATAVATSARRPIAATLRRGVRAEVVVLSLALIAGAVLAQVPPPNLAEAGVEGGSFSRRQPFGDGELELTVAPGERGVNEVHVTALAPDGRLMVEAEDLVLAMELPEEEVGPIEPEMQVITAGHSTTYARVPLEGEWTFTVTSRTDQFTELRAEFRVPIAR